MTREEIVALSEKATPRPWFVRKRPTDDGLAVIEDGRQHGLFPITGEWPEIEFIVALVNAVRSGELVHRDEVEAQAREIAELKATNRDLHRRAQKAEGFRARYAGGMAYLWGSLKAARRRALAAERASRLLAGGSGHG